MSSVAVGGPSVDAGRASVLPSLAWLEIRSYLRHPLFVLGMVLTVLSCAAGPEAQTSTMFLAIVPATAIGVLGIVIMASLTRRSVTITGVAGIVTVPERSRTLALVAACAVPFVVGLAWWVWAVAAFHSHPPTANGFPFGSINHDAWAAAVLFGEGPLACLGGAILGIVVGRWVPRRGAPAVVAVAVIAFCLVFQGLFEPLRRIRVAAPWTYWGGPYGVDGDPNRMLAFSGSPYWWVAYVACLCGLGILAALLHDRETPRRPLWRAAAVLGVVAVITVVLAAWTGTPHTLVNPLPS
jgi:hypothetical protein